MEEERSRAKLTPFGAIVIAMLVGAVVAVIFGSRSVEVAGVIVGLIAIGLIGADRLPEMLRALPAPRQLRNAPGVQSDPAYVERTAPTSADVLKHEQELYHERDERERAERAQRPPPSRGA
jgi:hypothetical protein